MLPLGVAAWAQESYASCWVEERWDPILNTSETVTVCRLMDGNLQELSGDTPPGVVEPAVGTDADGVCWFWTSIATPWELLSTFSDGSAILGMYINGFLAVDTGQIPRCTSEPIVTDPPPVLAWEAITEYVHDPPAPDLNPPIGLGLTGLETHAGVVVPGEWSDTITVPGYSIDVEVSVGALTIDWGDRSIDTFPPTAFDRMDGYPDGLARHVYEVKTCDPPGRDPDCDADLGAYPVTVAYRWDARWRVNGSDWVTVDVPPSETAVDYPVTEAVSVLTDAG